MIVITLCLMKNILRLAASSILRFFPFTLDLGKAQLLKLGEFLLTSSKEDWERIIWKYTVCPDLGLLIPFSVKREPGILGERVASKNRVRKVQP